MQHKLVSRVAHVLDADSETELKLEFFDGDNRLVSKHKYISKFDIVLKEGVVYIFAVNLYNEKIASKLLLVE